MNNPPTAVGGTLFDTVAAVCGDLCFVRLVKTTVATRGAARDLGSAVLNEGHPALDERSPRSSRSLDSHKTCPTNQAPAVFVAESYVKDRETTLNVSTLSETSCAL